MNAQQNLARAWAALDLGRAQDALREAGLAVAAEPENAAAYFALATALHRLDRLSEAYDALKAGLRQSADSIDLHVLLSDVLRADRQPKPALDAGQTAVSLDPDDPRAHAAVGLSLKALSRYDEAIGSLQRALELAPYSGYLHRCLADIYLDKPDLARAEQEYRRALSIDPNDAHALNNLGCALLRQNRSQAAAFAFKSAMLVDPTFKLAKENTHRTLRELLGGAGVLGAGAALFLKAGAWKLLVWLAIISRHAFTTAYGLATVGGLLLVGWGGMFARRRWIRARMLQQDPQILGIYQRLDADKKAGHL